MKFSALPSEIMDDNKHSILFEKFPSLIVGFDESSFIGRYDWIETIDNPFLADKLARLSDNEKELWALFVLNGYIQTEIDAIQGCTKQAVNKKLKRIKFFFKLYGCCKAIGYGRP